MLHGRPENVFRYLEDGCWFKFL